MTVAAEAVAALSFFIWLYLVWGRSFFWLARERDDHDEAAAPATWPSVCAVVPARDEADVIARSIGSLLAQDYPGAFRVILVDDDSSDGTAAAARAAAFELGREDRLHVIGGAPLPQGWTGKLWAVSQGVAHAATLPEPPEYLLLTDADIAHTPDNVRQLAARARAGSLVLVSLMAKLHCKTLAERTLIPAFVFFFDMLYPFGQVNDPKSSSARRRRAGDAGPAGRPRGPGRDRRHPHGDHRRLRHGGPDEAARSDLARPHRTGDQPSPLSDFRRDRADGFPLRLCSAALFTLAFGRYIAGHGADVSCSSLLRRVRPGRRALCGPRRLGSDGFELSAHAALLWPLAPVGSGHAADRRPLRPFHRAVGGGRVARQGRVWKGRAQAQAGKAQAGLS